MEELSGDALEPYRVPPLALCWWCGNARPLTAEHKFKAADLKRMWDSSEGLIWGDGDGHYPVRSVRKSKNVRFEKALCHECNHQRSQPLDTAYQKFSDYVWDRPGLWRSRFLDMEAIYGIDWPAENLNLARYVTKHIGCRMACDGFPVPSSFAQFLNGGSLLPDVQMVLFKSRDHHKVYKIGTRSGFDGRGLYISPAQGAVSRSRKCLSVYSSALIVNFIGVMYRWDLDCSSTDPFYQYNRARLHKRHKLPRL